MPSNTICEIIQVFILKSPLYGTQPFNYRNSTLQVHADMEIEALQSFAL